MYKYTVEVVFKRKNDKVLIGAERLSCSPRLAHTLFVCRRIVKKYENSEKRLSNDLLHYFLSDAGLKKLVC
jgi:hypothetical protein